jgi:hypothetical protein
VGRTAALQVPGALVLRIRRLGEEREIEELEPAAAGI